MVIWPKFYGIDLIEIHLVAYITKVKLQLLITNLGSNNVLVNDRTSKWHFWLDLSR